MASKNFKYSYIKAFKGSRGKMYFCNVSVLQDGDIEVSISFRDLKQK